MKKLFLILLLVAPMFFFTQNQSFADDSPPGIDTEQINTFVAIDNDIAGTVQSNLPEPNFTPEDLINIPINEGGNAWVKYIVGILIVLFYNFGASMFKTKRSITISALLYKLGNRIVKDKSKGGGVFDLTSKKK